MNRRTFWWALALMVGAGLLLPAVLVGLVAVADGVAKGNGAQVRAGAAMAGVALTLGFSAWWLTRRLARGGD